MSHDWNPLLPFQVTVTEGSLDTGPPSLTVDDDATLDDGRSVSVYLIPKYTDDFRTKEGYDRCYEHACRVRDLLNDEIAKIGMMAYRPG